jgi:DNA-directed RNA polymerase specialized sigma24 family protein
VCLARAGDIQALAALLERCRPSLYATAIRLLANRADALDAVQDTFVVALLRARRLARWRRGARVVAQRLAQRLLDATAAAT